MMRMILIGRGARSEHGGDFSQRRVCSDEVIGVVGGSR